MGLDTLFDSALPVAAAENEEEGSDLAFDVVCGADERDESSEVRSVTPELSSRLIVVNGIPRFNVFTLGSGKHSQSVETQQKVLFVSKTSTPR